MCPRVSGATGAVPSGAPPTRRIFFHPKVTHGRRRRRVPARRMPRIRGATAQRSADRMAGMRVASLRDDRGRGRRGAPDPTGQRSYRRHARTTRMRPPTSDPRPAIGVVDGVSTVVTAIPTALKGACHCKVTPVGATRQAAPYRPLRPQFHHLRNVPNHDHRRRLTGPSACATRACRDSPGRGTARLSAGVRRLRPLLTASHRPYGSMVAVCDSTLPHTVSSETVNVSASRCVDEFSGSIVRV